MASASNKTTGFVNLLCPICMGADAMIRLNLANLDECYCEDCGDTFSVQRAIEHLTESLEEWRKVERLVEFGRELANE
jgi:hypothetical protein